MSIASDVNAARLKHLYLSPETPASIGGNVRFLHKQRISIENWGMFIRTLCSMFLFRQKVAGRGVSEKAVSPPFCHKAGGRCFALHLRTQPVPVGFRRLPVCMRLPDCLRGHGSFVCGSRKGLQGMSGAGGLILRFPAVPFPLPSNDKNNKRTAKTFRGYLRQNPYFCHAEESSFLNSIKKTIKGT
ncbi:hypothetical protein [uncultured Bacteroides sp.]|uniref:hypothetical protein n=2 Tax=uncultured Bacteroides sp. TaxID=162156 RepID=UPI00261050C5|nr:hypothetical protein [uncultured Bacteroides sp.]